jgi:hypothetical protein
VTTTRARAQDHANPIQGQLPTSVQPRSSRQRPGYFGLKAPASSNQLGSYRQSNIAPDRQGLLTRRWVIADRPWRAASSTCPRPCSRRRLVVRSACSMEPHLRTDMDPQQHKEQFSRAYLQVVAAAAGYRVSIPFPDDDSVDCYVSARGPHGTVRSPMVAIQAKGTATVNRNRDPYAFRLPRKNYDDLRHDDYGVPRLLVVVLVPHDPRDWLAQSHDDMVARYCGYWMSLCNLPEMPAEQGDVTVHIPRHQVFDVPQLHRIMQLIGEKRFP